MIVAASLFAAIVLAPAGSFGTQDPDAGLSQIAFLRLTSGFWQVWLMGSDGSGQRALTRTPVDKVHAAWRPGTSEILYHTNAGETYLLDPVSGQERRLLAGLTVTDAAWSPDGQRLAYGLPPEDLARGKTALWVSGLDGTDRRRLAGGSGSDALAPWWLPEKGILFRQCLMANHMEVKHNFLLLDPAGDQQPGMIQGDDEPLKFDQAVSGPGNLAYSSPRSGSYEIWTLPMEGREPRQITTLNAYAGNPTWSPDGNWLAFDSNRDGAQQIYRVGTDGQGLARLTNDRAPSRKPVWSLRGAVPATAPNLPEGSSKTTGPTVAAQRVGSPRSSLALSWVSTDRSAFDPSKGERLALRFRVSSPAVVTARFLDADGNTVRTAQQKAEAAGEQQVVWDGRDDRGRPVPPEAYEYTLQARGAGGEEVTYDLRGRTGGEAVWPVQPALDPKTGRITYSLTQASRVRLIVSQQDTTWPIRALLDWAPREAGKHEEAWDGWGQGHVVKAPDTPEAIPILYAFGLPREAVIVKGSANAERNQKATLRSPNPPLRLATDRPVHLHARHPRARCYNPTITLSSVAAGQRTKEGLLRITQGTPLRVDVAADQGSGRAQPVPRVSVFIYVDGVAVERYLVGYVPFQWVLDPATMKPGDHVVTALLAWRDDHFGIAHLKVKTESGGGAQ